MVEKVKLETLRRTILESLRVQRGSDSVAYIDAGNALQDAAAKQNHAIFARRGCGKTLLLQNSRNSLNAETAAVYLNCEDFKRHTFPNVLIEILIALFKEIRKNLSGWFGKKAKSRALIDGILKKLQELHKEPDVEEQQIKHTSGSEDAAKLAANATVKTNMMDFGSSAEATTKATDQTEKNFRVYKEELKELDHWLPEIKDRMREFFEISGKVKSIILQIDDLYHLKRADQAFVMDYVHRLCKDVPIFFKVATIRHASTLFADRDGQPIGAQERHDYQPINIDYTFSDFTRTRRQNRRFYSSMRGAQK